MPNLVKKKALAISSAPVSPDLFINNPGNSIIHCPKIHSWSSRPKTILAIRKKVTFLTTDFTNHRKTTRVAVFSCRPFSNILKYRDHWWDCPAIRKQDFFRHILTSSASLYKSSGSVLSNDHWNTIRTRYLGWVKVCFDLFNHLESYIILHILRLVLEWKTHIEIPASSRLDFLDQFLANNFDLSDGEDNTSGPLNRGGIADLSLLRTLLTIHQKPQEPSFWEVMDSFLLAYASLQA